MPEPRASASTGTGEAFDGVQLADGRSVGSDQPPIGRPYHCHNEVAGGRRKRGRRRKEKEEGRIKEEKKRKEKEGGRHWQSALGQSLAAKQAPGGASGGPRPPSTSLPLVQVNQGRQREGGTEGGGERENKRGKGLPKALPSHGSQTDSRILVWARRHAHRLAIPVLGRHLVGSGRPPTCQPCQFHKEVSGERRNRGRRRKEKKEGRRKEEKKKERKGRWPSSAVGAGPVAGS